MKITVLGTGSWGTALAKVLCDNHHKVTLWGRDEQYIQQMKKEQCNKRYLKDFLLPSNLNLSSNLEDLQDCNFIVNATPVQYTRTLFEKMTALPFSIAPIVNSSKGLELKSLKCVSQIVEDVFGKSHAFAVISGPSHAEEVMKELPTSVSVASKDKELAKLIQNAFMNNYMRIYTSTDVTGVEIGGALKNIFAIAAGAIDGMGLGDNTKSALMTRGVAEMTRIGVFLGGDERTFMGLSGIGDLMVTCMSKFSRNRFVGESLGKGMTFSEIRKAMGGSVAEGVTTIKSVYELVKKHNLDAPIIEESYQVIYNDCNIKDALTNLMMRKAKEEN